MAGLPMVEVERFIIISFGKILIDRFVGAHRTL
jgi:hypothetical protein